MEKPIPVIKEKGFLSTTLEFAENPLTYITKATQNLGDTFVLKLRLSQLMVSSDAEVCKHILQSNQKNYVKDRFYKKLKLALGEGLLMNEGASWKKQRKLAQPAFYKKRLDQLFDVMADISTDYARELDEHKASGKPFNITNDVLKITSDVVMQTLLGTGNIRSNQEIQEIIAETQEYIVFNIRKPFLAIFSKITGRHKRIMKKMRQFDQMIFDIIAEREKNHEPKNDLLDMLMSARDEDGEAMSKQQLRDEVITIYVAGHETSANALSWTIYQLCQNPEIKSKLIQEIRTQLQGRKPTLEDIKAMPYLMQVIQESMRLYPPAWSVSRECLEDDSAGGYEWKAGQIVFLCIHALHRHPDYWEEPLKFKPGRFSPEQVKKRPSHYYIPFGAGPRMCIGNHFAMMEIAIILASIFDRHDFELDSKQQIEAVPLVTLQPHPGVGVRVI